MKFILHEIKLWFKKNDSEPKSYHFLPNKVNVITGNATTGKTSFWSIIDYCLLASNVKIPNSIYEKVLWFGINFTINDKDISIVRKTPDNGIVANEVYFNYGALPDIPAGNNKEIIEIKAILNTEFGITDSLGFSFGKELGKYRYFLLFNALTETIIGAPETYFDTVFFGKQEYDKALSYIFNLVIRANDIKKIKALERLKEITKELKAIEKEDVKYKINLESYKNDIFILIDRCKQYNFIEDEDVHIVEDVDEVIKIIQNLIENKINISDDTKILSEIDDLREKKKTLQIQINEIKKYYNEYNLYKRNLGKAADSLQPIEFLHEKLSDQLVDSYETKMFIDSLKSSLKNIKNNLNKKVDEPLKMPTDMRELQDNMFIIDKKIDNLTKTKTKIETEYQKEKQKFIAIGEIKYALAEILKRKTNEPIENLNLNRLNEEKVQLEKIPYEIERSREQMIRRLDESIQRNYNQLKSLPVYKNYNTRFDEKEMILRLYPQDGFFAGYPLDNVGSKSNYVFMHLCTYLGLHEHFISVGQEYVPQFLFIDQPSIPYYSDNTEKGNDDKTKLMDAFSLLNSFLDYIVNKKQNHFQIFMVEHAPKEYWIKSKLKYFHTVDEFINGNGLIPKEIYNG